MNDRAGRDVVTFANQEGILFEMKHVRLQAARDRQREGLNRSDGTRLDSEMADEVAAGSLFGHEHLVAVSRGTRAEGGEHRAAADRERAGVVEAACLRIVDIDRTTAT